MATLQPRAGMLGQGRLPTIPSDVEEMEAHAVLRVALETLGPQRLGVCTSFGPESIVILDLLSDMDAHPRVFTIDTDRLPKETHELMDRVQARFGIEIEVIRPDPDGVGEMIQDRGPELYYRSLDDRLRCCDVRKVQPLTRALSGFDGWVTGVRRDQAPTRARTPKLGLDIEHGMIWKASPIADWTAKRVWDYIRHRDLPYNDLHDDGYPSIGCIPCSRPVPAGADPRSGRWWWETDESRECGLHVDQAQIATPGRSEDAETAAAS